MLDRIRVDPEVCNGKPGIRGTRVTVDFVLKLLGDAYTADDIVREYPESEKDDDFQSAKCRISVSARRLPNCCYE